MHQNSSSVHCFVFVVGLFFTRTELRPWSCSGCSFITRRRPLKTVRETLQRQRFQCRPMPFVLDLIILAMHIWILIRVALLNRVGDARIQTSNWFGTGWLEFRSNGMVQCRTDNANIPVHPVQPGHMIYWARLCDIPDASFLTTLFVGVSGKHFFMGLVKRIGSLNFVRLRAFAFACVCACVLLLLLYFSV